jgi:hypothetical protein
MLDPVHVWSLRLGQPTAAAGAQALQEALHAFGVQRADGQRRLDGSGYPDDRDGSPQRDIDIDILQVVSRAARTPMAVGSVAGTDISAVVVDGACFVMGLVSASGQ